MSDAFHHVSRSLRLDRGGFSVAALSAAVALLAAWIGWACVAQVTEYEISDSARLEVAGAAYPLQASAAGQLVRSQLILGRSVKAGDILLELQDTDQRLSLAQEESGLAALAPQLAALHSQMHSEQNGTADEQDLLAFSTEGAQAQYRQAQAQEVFAIREADRANQLRAEGLISEAEAQRAAAEVLSRRAVKESLASAISRLQPELGVRDRAREVRVKQLLEDTAKLEAEVAAATARVTLLKYELEKRRIRAPVAGTLSECATVLPGAHITEGEQLGVIIPGRGLAVIAEFEPAAAFGKLHRGQNAIVRLQGFPWAQFGILRAQVAYVAGEIRDGKVRVELAVQSNTPSRIPFQHGMPGSVEVETGRISPISLLLRSAGQAIGAH